MKALLDTNVILDWVLRRQPFAKSAQDATQAATALAHGIEIIITRDKTFSISSLQTHSPSEFLALL